MIRIHGLTKNFGMLKAVDGLDLEIPQGEFFAFLGPNAAGKTTTIKMLAGLLKPTSGSVIVGGFDMQCEPEKAKAQLAYVPDFPFLYDKLTALGWKHGREWSQVAHIHDEIQANVLPDLATFYGQSAVASIREAGEHYKFRIRLDGEFKVGRNWAETH